MALPVINTSDFKGFYKLALNEFKTEDLEDYIAEFTEYYIREIIGDAAFTDLKNQDFQKWTDLNAGIDFVDVDGNRTYLVGLQKPLIGFIYFEYVRDNFTSTVVGKVKGKSENSERATDIEVANLARSRFNKLVCPLNESLKAFLEANETLKSIILASYDLNNNTYLLSIENPKYLNTGQDIVIDKIKYTATEIQNFTIDAGATGLDFTGDDAIWTFEQSVLMSEDNGDNTYNLIVGSTEALSSGDTVTINGTDYTASNVIKDTCFTIDAGATGLDFTGETASWAFTTTVSISIDLTNNSYLLSVVDSTYVAEGATVNVDGTDYNIESLSNNYLIDAGATGLDFTGDSVEWSPYDAVEFTEIEIAGI